MTTSSVCKRVIRCVCSGSLLLFALGTAAAESDSLVLLDDAVRAVAEFAPGNVDGSPLLIEQAARTHHELGAVVDARPADGGMPRVLAITPGSAAARLDLRVGDRLLRVNGTKLLADQGTARALPAALQADGGRIALLVERGSQQLLFDGALDRVDTPAYQLSISPLPASEGCGRINLALKPPLSESIYPIFLHSIDGRLGGPLLNSLDGVYRLRAGRHLIKLSEEIPDDRFWGAASNHRRQQQRNQRFKTLEIDVQINTTYRIGARFNKDKADSVKDQAYWEPVIWKEFEENCR